MKLFFNREHGGTRLVATTTPLDDDHDRLAHDVHAGKERLRQLAGQHEPPPPQEVAAVVMSVAAGHASRATARVNAQRAAQNAGYAAVVEEQPVPAPHRSFRWEVTLDGAPLAFGHAGTEEQGRKYAQEAVDRSLGVGIP